MGSSLSSLFRDHYRLQFTDDEWSQEVYTYLQSQKIEKAKLKSLINSSFFEIDAPLKRIEALEKFLSALLLTYPYSMSYEDVLLPAAAQHLNDTLYDQNIYILTLKDTIRTLLEIKTTPHELSLITDRKKYLDLFKMPSPELNIKSILLSMILAFMSKNKDLKEKVTQNIHHIENLLNYKNEPHLALWSREADFKGFELLVLYYLLFYGAYHVLHIKRFEKLIFPMYQKIKNETSYTSRKAPIFLILISHLIDSLKLPVISYFDEEKKGLTHFLDERFAVLGQKDEKSSIIITYNGVGTGLGVMHAPGVKIKTFGPKLGPLNTSKGFGIYRPSNGDLESFKDLRMDMNQLDGWMRLVSPTAVHIAPDATWMLAKTKVYPRLIDLEANFRIMNENLPIHFAFYVSAERVLVVDQEVKKKDLHAFKGKVKSVRLMGRGHSIDLTTCEENILHVIPLAGEKTFWDADFLVAFELQSDTFQLEANLN